MPRVPRIANFIDRDYRLCFSRMQDVLKRCEQQLPKALSLLEEMVSMESPSYDKERTDKFVAFLSRQFTERLRPISAEVHTIPVERFGNHLRVRLSGKTAHRVLLLGHTDTVWPAGEIERRPFQIEGRRAL